MKADKRIFLGLFLVALTTLMYEILLSRIFSVITWYHLAFVAISMALFGMTVGAIIVYYFSNYFTNGKFHEHLAKYSFYFSISIIVSFLFYSLVNPVFNLSLLGILYLSLYYLIISLPFIFSGICICLVLSVYSSQISKLYATDLIGASLGCVLYVVMMNFIDGPSLVFFVAFLAALAAYVFSGRKGGDKKYIYMATAVTFFIIVFVNSFFAAQQNSVFKLLVTKNKYSTQDFSYEKWNSHSLVRVMGDPNISTKIAGWGLAEEAIKNDGVLGQIKQLYLNIDGSAGSYLTNFSGDFSELEFLKYDISNLAHHFRRDANVLVIGVGGGRDILSALVFDQRSVVGVEINKSIVDVVTKKYSDFVGNLHQYDNVEIINDEARSFVARSTDVYDIIQVSLIDTWASTVAGGLTLTENSLYTVEAWQEFFEHLSDDGVLTFTRWYFQDLPGEVYRLVSLARETLIEMGVENPRDHIVVIKNQGNMVDENSPDGIGTILVRKTPFSEDDLRILSVVVDKMGFETVLSPSFSADPAFESLSSSGDISDYLSSHPLNLSAPRDNNPFFFQMLRPKDFVASSKLDQGIVTFNLRAVNSIMSLLLVVIVLSLLTIILPLGLKARNLKLNRHWPLIAYFLFIGLGFMLIEISQMQRFNIFLGHPTFSLTVILFVLLISGGVGSYITNKIEVKFSFLNTFKFLVLLLTVLILFGFITTSVLSYFASQTNFVRIFITILMIFPLGIFMGTAFPLGIKFANQEKKEIIPWLWGINGATSVCASVLAVAISLSYGISVTYWVGFICYVLAFISLVFLYSGTKNPRIN